MKAKPTPPAARLICENCGDITTSGHTSWLCRLFGWIGRIPARKPQPYICPDRINVVDENDILVLVFKTPMRRESLDCCQEYLRRNGVRAVAVDCDEVYIQHNPGYRQRGKKLT